MPRSVEGDGEAGEMVLGAIAEGEGVLLQVTVRE